MGAAFESKYFVDGKPYMQKKKNGVYNNFKHIKFPFLDVENEINMLVSYVEDKGMKDADCRDAYETIYKYYKFREIDNG